MSIRRLSAFLATTLLPLGLLSVLAGPAHADHASESHSDAQFLDASLLGLDLSTIAGIDGADADYLDGHTTGTEDFESEILDVTALGAINLQLGNELTVGDLLQLGVVGQEALAGPDGDSWATTDTASASLDLMTLLGPNAALSQATLGFGAVGTFAEIDGATGQLTRTTTIADLELALRSPLVAALTVDVNTAVTTLTTQVDDLEQPLTTALDTAVNQVLALVSFTGTVVPDETVVDIDTSRLDQAIAGVLNQTVCTGLTCIDLTTGTITVDLDAQPGGIDLNSLAPNTTLTGLLTQVSGDVATLLGQVQDELDEILTDALDHVDITLHAGAQVTAPTTGTDIGGFDVDYSGSLGTLLDGTSQLSMTTNGTVGGLLDPVLTTATNIVRNAILTTVDTTLGTAVADAGAAVDALVTDLAAALDPVLTALAGVASITLNEQNASDGLTSEAWVTAIDVDVLTGPLAGVTLDLATSTVGPNVHAPISPTVDATDDPVSGGTEAPVDGAGWHPASEVTLALLTPDGSPVLDGAGNAVTVTVTTDGTGAFTTTVPLPEGLAAGDHTVRATDTIGNTATDTIAVIAPVLDATDQPVAPGDDAPVTSSGWTPNTNVTLQLTDGAGNPVGDPVTVATDADGSFPIGTTFPVPPEARDGGHTLTGTDPFGNTASDTLVVDATAPVVAITSPTDGSTTADSTPTIAGTVDNPDTTTVDVVITDPATGDVVFEGPATVNPDGTWTVEAPTLADGDYAVTATATDESGNTATDGPVAFTVDTVAPQAPVITSPADGSTITDTTPLVTGTGEPGATVEVKIDGVVVGTATVAEDGTWQLPLTEPLSGGQHTVSATQTDAAGNTSPASQNTFTVDVTVAPPVITSPADGDEVSQTPTVTGTGEPGATITVYADGEPVAATTVDDGGTWSVTLADELACGAHTLTATQAMDGVSSRTQSEPVDVTVACPTGGDGGLLPDTGSPLGVAVLVLMTMLGLALVAGGTALTRRHRG